MYCTTFVIHCHYFINKKKYDKCFLNVFYIHKHYFQNEGKKLIKKALENQLHKWLRKKIFQFIEITEIISLTTFVLHWFFVKRK